MQISNNPHLIGVCSIAAVLVIAFWGFGLADKIMPHEKITETQTLRDSKPVIPPAESKIFLPAPVNAESKNTSQSYHEQKSSKMERADKSSSRLDLLEKSEFQLDLSGTYYAGSPSTSRPARLEMRIHPVSGANLESFQVIDAKLWFDTSRVSIENPSVTIKESNVLITFASGAVGSFDVKGVLDEPIASDKDSKQTVVIENQLFYLVQKDIPYHIDMTGTLSSS